MNMMKWIAAAVALLAPAGTVAAAGNGAENANGPMWGVRGALDLNIPGRWHGDAGSVKMYRNGFGATLGAVCNIPLGRSPFYLEPGVSFFYDTYSYDGLTVMGADDSEIHDPGICKLGVRVPVVAGYDFVIAGRLNMTVYTGPELSYAFSGKVKLNDDQKQIVGDDFDNNIFGRNGQSRIDCAWKVGVGFPIDNMMVGVDAAIGMTDLLRTPMSFRENRVSVSFTYYL